MYFFKTSNSWVVGRSQYSLVPIAAFFIGNLDPVAGTVNILPVIKESNLERFNGISVTSIKKNANGDLYASVSEFMTAVSSYFAVAASPSYVPGNNGTNGLFSTQLAVCADYPALKAAMIAAGLMAAS